MCVSLYAVVRLAISIFSQVLVPMSESTVESSAEFWGCRVFFVILGVSASSVLARIERPDSFLLSGTAISNFAFGIFAVEPLVPFAHCCSP